MLQKAVGDLPAGPWAVGVSGGADSVALLLLLKDRSDLSLQVAHLDHETRSGESAADAVFVADLCKRLKIPCTIAKRSAIEAEMDHLSSNISSRYRQARFALFTKLVREQQLLGVMLAHHTDDQAETVLLRVLRGAAPANLAGMQRESAVRGLRILRPLLNVTGSDLRDCLRSRGQNWREDSSNQSDQYQRNRLRKWLAERPDIRDRLLKIESASSAAHHWLETTGPHLGESFASESLANLPLPLARHSAGRWLRERGAPPEQISSRTCHRLVEMCTDAAAASRQHFPGGLLVRRKAGMVFVEHPKKEFEPPMNADKRRDQK